MSVNKYFDLAVYRINAKISNAVICDLESSLKPHSQKVDTVSSLNRVVDNLSNMGNGFQCDIFQREKIEGLCGRLRDRFSLSSPPRPDFYAADYPKFQRDDRRMADLPRPFLFSVAGMLDEDDRSVLPCVSRLFKQTFTCALLSPTDKNAFILDRVRGCTVLTSLKTLRSQLNELKKHCPNYLGKDKPWTLSEVLKLYSLKKIDFSQERVSLEDVRELMTAFLEITKSGTPKRTITIEAQAGIFASQIYRGEALRDRLIELAGVAGIKIDSSLTHQDLWETVVCELIKKPTADVAKLMHGFPDLYESENSICLTEPESRDIFGDIEIFNMGLVNRSLDFNEFIRPFLKAFCPKLKVFIMNCSDNSRRLVENFFAAADRKDTLICLETSYQVMYREITSNLALLFGCHKHLQQVLASHAISNYPELRLLADCCPQLTQLSLSAALLREKGARVKETFFRELGILSKKCLKIEKLTLVHVNEEELSGVFFAVGKMFKNLKELTIWNWGNNGAQRLTPATLRSFLLNCPPLGSLTFQGAGFNWENRILTDAVVSQFPLIQPELEELTVYSDINRLTDLAILRFVKNSLKMTKLHLNSSRKDLEEKFAVAFQLRRLNKILKEKKGTREMFLKEFKKLPSDVIKKIYDAITWHSGQRDHSFGKRLLEEDIHVLLRYSKPYTLFTGNLLEQEFARVLSDQELVMMRDKKDEMHKSLTLLNITQAENFLTLLEDNTLTWEQCVAVYNNSTRMDARQALAVFFEKNSHINNFSARVLLKSSVAQYIQFLHSSNSSSRQIGER